MTISHDRRKNLRKKIRRQVEVASLGAMQSFKESAERVNKALSEAPQHLGTIRQLERER